MNIRLLIEYDGAPYCGWQRQLNGPTIQAILEDKLSEVTGKKTTVYGASRTDSGVHARGQVACFDTEYPLPPERWQRLLNFHLPYDIRILESREVPLGWSPQKLAVAKEYEYVICNRPMASALQKRCYFVPQKIHWGRVREALPQFLGTHDFRAFQGAKAEVISTVRTIHRLDLLEQGDGFYALRIVGDGFLKQMVRAVAGTLVEIGLGKRDIGDVERIVRSLDRDEAGHTAPAAGLTLLRVYYPGE
ncbi:tRNA pseudouridine(38-40) synthase TruA [bacterium]|nr:tRNA pseudouridine(38-40) synthase TruA [bacterium]